MTDLPIDPLLPEVVAAMRDPGVVVLEAPPGAGKTTRVPPALLAAGFAEGGEILVLQPRRLPTCLAARRVAEELGEAVGQRVGYTVRFEDVAGPKTRVRFVTEGILLRRLLADPTLRGVSAVLLDEFHERHLDADLALALLARLRKTTRPDLALAVMSATLDAAPIAAFLGAPILRSEGRRFEVAIEHADRPSERPLEEQVAAALRRVVREEAEGDVLVFLPGAAEIRRAGEAIADLARERDLLVLPLHGDLPLAEQSRAVAPAARRKVLLSTNVAETSVTIDGVTAVIDSGLARIAGHSSWSGLPTLSLGKISKASAIQRAGRAGRTRPGRALRLYPREDFEARPAQDAPEIRRLDLSQAVLLLRGAGVQDPAALAWLDAPPAPALEAAELLLRRLGAVDPALTNTGKRMLSLPLHPRLARLCVEGESRGVANQAALVAALLGERDVRTRGARGQGPSGPSDLTELGERLERVAARRQAAAAVGLEPGAAARVIRVAEQLGRSLRDSAPRPRGPAAWEEALGLAVLAAFPDRVARRRAPRSRELVLCEGGSAQLAEDSVVTEAPFLCAVDVEERTGAGRAGRLVRFASAVEPEWLLERSDYLAERDTLVWNATDARVDRVTALAYGAVVLEESRSIADPSPETTRVLAEAALARGADAFDLDAARGAVHRISLVATHFPDAGLPALSADSAREVLFSACEGLRSFAELRAIAPGPRLLGSLTGAQQALVAKHAPERLTLPNGRGAQVHYDADRPPWIESRLQDFFGLAEGPRICAGRVPLVLHLLAPNGRAVQVTQDLAGFWERHYPAIRRELGRRYPRHSWPEDGSTAAPTPPRGR